ncbi:MAG: hypothetical protein PHU77_00330 [Simplicispira sp.]|nr:hypothetical protein [Simplicispira sp.]
MSNTDPKPGETMPLWRYEKLRAASVDAMRIAAKLLAHAEGVYTIDEADVYHELVELNKTLATGIFEGTQP